MSSQEKCARVLRWLEENERSISWLARRIDWSRSLLSQVLNGKRPLSPKLWKTLCEALELETDDTTPVR